MTKPRSKKPKSKKPAGRRPRAVSPKPAAPVSSLDEHVLGLVGPAGEAKTGADLSLSSGADERAAAELAGLPGASKDGKQPAPGQPAPGEKPDLRPYRPDAVADLLKQLNALLAATESMWTMTDGEIQTFALTVPPFVDKYFPEAEGGKYSVEGMLVFALGSYAMPRLLGLWLQWKAKKAGASGAAGGPAAPPGGAGDTIH